MEVFQEILKAGFRNVRPPKAGKSGVEFWSMSGSVRVRFLKGDFVTPNRLGTGDGEDFLVDVGGENRGGGMRENFCPISGAAGDFKNVETGKSIFEKLAQFCQIGLTLGFLVNTLVFWSAPGVVADHGGFDAHAMAPDKRYAEPVNSFKSARTVS